MRVGPFFDSALSVKLSQHLFNIQFARYIQDSNQGHFTQKPANFPASSQQNENEPPIVTPNIPSDSVDQAVPQDAGSTGLGSTAPAPAQAAFSGNTAAPTPISQSNNDMDRLGLAHFDQRLEETNQLLKTISRTLFSTHFNVQRGYGAGGRYHSYLTMNNKGELPSVRNLPIVIPGSSSTLQGAITKQALADYLNFYDIGTDLIEEDTGDIKADRDADAQKVLAHYLWFGHPPASQVPALHDHKLSTQLAQYLFTIQMAVYRNEYPSNVFPVENIYAPPSVPSHIPISLEPVIGSPSDDQLESVHGAVRTLEGLAHSPFYDTTFGIKLSQHLFNIQFARYIQDSNQGHFTQKPANLTASSQQNEDEPPIATSNPPSDNVAQIVPQDPVSTGLSSSAPIPSQVTLLGNTTAEPAPGLQSTNDINKLDLARSDQRSEETNQLLKKIGQALLSTHFNAQR
ncbi:unnamed protein product, partial [Rhizoctonia solani]